MYVFKIQLAIALEPELRSVVVRTAYWSTSTVSSALSQKWVGRLGTLNSMSLRMFPGGTYLTTKNRVSFLRKDCLALSTDMGRYIHDLHSRQTNAKCSGGIPYHGRKFVIFLIITVASIMEPISNTSPGKTITKNAYVLGKSAINRATSV